MIVRVLDAFDGISEFNTPETDNLDVHDRACPCHSRDTDIVVSFRTNNGCDDIPVRIERKRHAPWFIRRTRDVQVAV
jgi:hypothetical protein